MLYRYAPLPGTPIPRRIALYLRHNIGAIIVTANVVTAHVLLFKFMYSDVVNDVIGKDTPRPFVKVKTYLYNHLPRLIFNILIVDFSLY